MKIKIIMFVKKIFEILKGEYLKLFRNLQNLINIYIDCEYGMFNNKIVFNLLIDYVFIIY